MRILLLSAYDAVSHRQWREGLVAALPEHDWTVLTLPPRHFSWRIRGNGLSWGMGERAVLEQPFDCLIATSMVDLATLKGLVPSLASVPSLVYFHENQFDYPVSEAAHKGLEPKVVNLYSALAAHRLVFNSVYNQQTFLQGVSMLLNKMPDAVPAGIVDALAARSAVLPVPLKNDWFDLSQADRADVLTIVWNHRWEYDKAPEIFFQALGLMMEKKVRFRVHVLGQAFRTVPDMFSGMRERLGDLSTALVNGVGSKIAWLTAHICNSRMWWYQRHGTIFRAWLCWRRWLQAVFRWFRIALLIRNGLRLNIAILRRLNRVSGKRSNWRID